MAPADKIVLERFRSRLHECDLEPEEIIFHGSRARGEAHEDSDYDLLLIYPEVNLDLKNTVTDISSRLYLDYGDFIHAIAISHYDAYESPERGSIFMINVYDDGIEL